jgi:mRNA interferase MazF
MGSSKPLRGDIWLASLGAGRRGEPGKNRPAVVISADWIFSVENDELLVIVPLSRSRSLSAVRPHLGPETGIDHPSVAVCPATRGVAHARLLRRLGEVEPKKMAGNRRRWREIERAVELVLDLDRRTTSSRQIPAFEEPGA